MNIEEDSATVIISKSGNPDTSSNEQQEEADYTDEKGK